MGFWEGIFRNEKEFRELIDSHLSFDGEDWTRPPLIASLMLTYNCNLKCIYCPFRSFGGVLPERPVHEWEEVLERLASEGVRRFSFSGGEPLLYPGIVPLIEKATKLGINKGIVTNGTGLTEERLKMFSNSGLNALTVSIDTVDDGLYSNLCNVPPGTLAMVLKMIVAARRLGCFWTGINTVITKLNVNAMEPLIEFCFKHDITVQFQVVNLFLDIEYLLPAAEDLKGAVDYIKKYKKAGGAVANSNDYLDACCEFGVTRQFPHNMECLIPFVEMVVTPDLKLKACCASEEIGDVSNPEWKKKWRGGEANHWRLMARSKECRDCFLIYHEPLEFDHP